MFRKTKIICTLGPSVNSYEKIRSLVSEGMNVARLNCSHGDWETRNQWVKWIREAGDELNEHVGILLDLSGPKFRLGNIPPHGLKVEVNDIIKIGTGKNQLPILEEQVLKKIRKGTVILIGDGHITFLAKDADTLLCTSGGTIWTRQGITLLGESFDVPTITEKDKEDLDKGLQLGVEYVAQSYVKSASDVRELGSLVEQHDPTVRIIAKIELKSAVNEIQSIIKEADGIMVARGDLGLQMHIEDVPLIQKKIIQMCQLAGKPVITATEMMESMVHNPRPTRAEATDVANAILDGTDAVMLSAETAVGKNPELVVRNMAKIAAKTESSSTFAKMRTMRERSRITEATEAVAYAACEIAENLNAKSILTFSTSGFTARMMAKYRPRVPILCATYRERTAKQVSLLWGVKPILTSEFSGTEEMIEKGFRAALKNKLLKVGDLVVITAGIPVGKPGTTNLVTLMNVHEPKKDK